MEIGAVDAPSQTTALNAARRQYAGVARVVSGSVRKPVTVAQAKPVAPSKSPLPGEVTRSPKVPGRNYWPQKPPHERGYERKSVMLRTGESAAFDADAKVHGLTPAAYLRKLWTEDRARRDLPPWEPSPKPDSNQ